MRAEHWLQLASIIGAFLGVVLTAGAGVFVALRKSDRERPAAADKAAQLQGTVSEMDEAQNKAIAAILARLTQPPTKTEAEAAIEEIRRLTEALNPEPQEEQP
jgi:gas vesicle protein